MFRQSETDRLVMEPRQWSFLKDKHLSLILSPVLRSCTLSTASSGLPVWRLDHTVDHKHFPHKHMHALSFSSCMCACWRSSCLLYLRQWALLGQGALVHFLQELLQSVPHCGVTPLLRRQVLQFRAAGYKDKTPNRFQNLCYIIQIFHWSPLINPDYFPVFKLQQIH